MRILNGLKNLLYEILSYARIVKKDTQYSAGAVIVKDDKVLLLRRKSPYNDWTFPKGKLENQESSEEAAIREAKEETNLDVKVTRFLAKNSYKFFWSPTKTLIKKEVVYYLASAITSEIRLASSDNEKFEKFEWMEYQNAINSLKHGNEKAVLKEAFEK